MKARSRLLTRTFASCGALMWLLRHDKLGSGGKEPIISEEIHWFLFFAKKFEDHPDCASSLIEQHFSSEQYSD
jgi:hypothetical protein